MNTRQKLLVSLAVLVASAGSPLLAEESASSSSGLLGRNHFELRYVWHNLSDSPVDANGFAADINWTVRPSLDLTMSYESLETEEYFGISADRRTILIGLRVMTAPARSRFYVEAAAGYAWASVTTLGNDNASAYRFGLGAEFACTPSILLTPFMNVTGYGSDSDSTTLNYGVKGSFLLGQTWHFSASLQRDDDNSTAYGLGFGFRF